MVYNGHSLVLEVFIQKLDEHLAEMPCEQQPSLFHSLRVQNSQSQSQSINEVGLFLPAVFLNVFIWDITLCSSNINGGFKK